MTCRDGREFSRSNKPLECPLIVTGLSAGYAHGISVIQDISMRAEACAVTLIIGPNGAGKSTLIKAIGGLVPFVRGQVSIGDEDIAGWKTKRLLRRGVALVPQIGTLFLQMDVLENLMMGGWIRRREKMWLRDRISDLCDLFQIPTNMLHNKAGALSGGQRKLVEVMRSVVLEPSVLLLDEPTAGLSPKLALELYQTIRNMPRELGVTILMVDQNVRDSLPISDYVYVLAMGRNDDEGTSASIEARLDEITARWLATGVSGVVG